jgi:hypothetical protein
MQGGESAKNSAVNALRYTIVKKKKTLSKSTRVKSCRLLWLVVLLHYVSFLSGLVENVLVTALTQRDSRAFTCLISLSGEIITLCKRSIAGGSS